ncbi:MAG: hypothetical protein IPM74_12040 [Crocinitomicaceae bacterium]|nr:hypothetical protein [Crocinitomicaceae bacterium]MBK8926604.1 hypothetical protein [Crocinitomicaceae bacterium]
MQFFYFFPLCMLLSIPAIIVSAINARKPSRVMFNIGAVLVAFILLLYLVNASYVWNIFLSGSNVFSIIMLLAFPGVPIYFLISSKTKRSNPESEVTDEYLDSIINEEDDEIK